LLSYPFNVLSTVIIFFVDVNLTNITILLVGVERHDLRSVLPPLIGHMKYRDGRSRGSRRSKTSELNRGSIRGGRGVGSRFMHKLTARWRESSSSAFGAVIEGLKGIKH